MGNCVEVLNFHGEESFTVLINEQSMLLPRLLSSAKDCPPQKS